MDPSPVSRLPLAESQEQPFCLSALTLDCVSLLLSSMERALSETELNPNVLTNLGSGSKEHGQVIESQSSIFPAGRIMQIDNISPQPLSFRVLKVIAEDPR